MDADLDNFQIDPELWLHFSLAARGDQAAWKTLVDHISRNTGLVPEKVEEILDALIKVLLEMTHSN